MSIVKMKHLKMLVLAQERDELLAKLMPLGCVEISQPDDQLADPDWTQLLGKDISGLSQVRGQLAELNDALAALNRFAPVKGGLFPPRPLISEEDFLNQNAKELAVQEARFLNEKVSQLEQLANEAVRLNGQRAALMPWNTLDLPLELEETPNVFFVMGMFPISTSLDTVRGELAQKAELADIVPIVSDKTAHYVLLVCHKSQWTEMNTALKPFTFTAARFKGMTGTAAANIQTLNEELSANADQQEAIKAEIAAHADRRADLQLTVDRLEQDAQRESARENGLTDGTIVFMEGWVAVPKLKKVEALLEERDIAYSLTDPEEGDDVPIKLDNPKWMQGINMVSEMYAMPSYDGVDPNPLIFGWYVLFFGFMFADLAYGIVIWLISYLVLKKGKPKGGMQQMFSLGQWLGASTAIFGFFTGGFFGNSITVFAETFLGIPFDQLPGWLQAFSNGFLFNPINDSITTLVVAIVIGFFQLVCGQCIHIYMEARDGHLVSGLLDVVPWWVFFVGLGVTALTGSSTGVIVGMVGLVLTQGHSAKGFFGKLLGGFGGLYNITSWLSDLLSYARLMALMLATSVIAMVFNSLAALPKNIIVFLVIFVIGHTFNLGINLIGTYVHAARLQYLEYYGKFFKDGGVPFQPLKYNTKFVDIDEEE